MFKKSGSYSSCFHLGFQMARKLLAPSGELLGPNFNTFSGRGEKSVSQRETVKSDQNDVDKTHALAVLNLP